MLKFRFPNIFKADQENLAKDILGKPIEFMWDGEFAIGIRIQRFLKQLLLSDSDELCLSLLMSYLTDNGNNGTSRSYPIEIGAEYSSEQRDSMAKFLVSYF